MPCHLAGKAQHNADANEGKESHTKHQRHNQRTPDKFRKIKVRWRGHSQALLEAASLVLFFAIAAGDDRHRQW